VNYLEVIDRVTPGSRDAETASEFRAGLLAVMRGEHVSFSLEYPCHSPTEQRWFIAHITRFSGDGPLRVVIAHENITRRKLAELATLEANRELDLLHKAVLDQNLELERTVNERTAQLRVLNHRMSTILDNVGDAILLLDNENRIDSANLAFHRLFGHTPEEVAGRSILNICVPQESEALAKTLRSVSNNGGTHRVQLTAGTKEGQTFDADFALAQVRDNTGHMVCSIRDITTLKEVERVKDQFVSMVTHELRTPLASIVLGVDTLQKYFNRLNDEQKLDKLLALRRQTDTLTELVNSVLDTARFNARRVQSTSEIIDLTQTLVSVVTDLKPQAELRQQTIELFSPDEALSITGDYTDFTRIWSNLLTNAIKYAGNKQVIMAGIWRCDDPTLPSIPELPFNAAEGGYLVGLVSDSGPGIRTQDMDLLFNRFFRGWAAETRIPGTGLGLSLVKDILRVYGGDISVRSEPDSGATFYFWLPADTSSHR
jgi:PAS domain S-box-containing protein